MIDRRPTLCVVAGPNGSGKTTTTIQLLNDEWAADSLYINPDNIAQEIFGDWNSPEAVLKAAEEATRLRYECLEQGRDFVYDNSIDNQLPRLLYRTTGGQLFKQYTDSIPEWAMTLIKL
ncbi:MAG: hypothetical protein ACSW77_03465 [Bacteroidales bacterium]